MNEAVLKRDRETLEGIYADEFVWVHGLGYSDDKARHIEDVLSVDAPRPAPVPDLGQLRVYGDVAVLRSTGRSPLAGSMFGTTIFARTGGTWRIVQTQGTKMLPERKAVKVDAKVLDAYAGTYAGGAGERLTVTRDGDSLRLRVAGVPVRVLSAESEGVFFDKLGSEIAFHRGDGGRVTHMIVRMANGQERRWARVE
jgi:hypothetical protein